MKKLIRIRVVQFFLYEKREIIVGKNCGIFGANGSGKSSLLDAVQIVMLGANASRGASGVSFNAQADESGHNTRSIRSYCLGQYGDASDARVRDNATTYITLIWLDTATKEVVSTGVCLAASGDRDGHDVLGRYIAPVDLSLDDHLEVVDGQERPKNWGTFRQMLLHRASHEAELLYHDSERFVTAMLFRLRGARGPARLDAFRQAFHFGLRMKFDRSVDEIVRQQVLEARPTNIKRFKDVLTTFQEMAALVRSVQAKLDEADLIEKDFAEAHRRFCQAVTWNGLVRDAEVGVANEAVGRAEHDERLAAQKLESVRAEADAAKRNVEAADLQAKSSATRRDKHASHTNALLLEQQVRGAQRTLSEDRARFSRRIAVLNSVLTQPIPGELVRKSADSQESASAGLARFLAGEVSSSPVVTEAAIQRALRAAKLLSNELLRELQAVARDKADFEQELQQAKGNLDRLAKGKAPLDGPAAALKRALADVGIEAVPVCDLVRVDDADWQPVIESYLGHINMQALLVDEANERKAFATYRRVRIYEAKVVLPTRFAQRGSPSAGTVAELISGNAAAAVNYLRSKLGQAQRAETEDECFSHRFAMTKDGMLVADGEIVRRRLTDAVNFKIGPVTNATRSSVTNAIARLEKSLRDCDAIYTKIKAIFDSFGPYTGDEEETLLEFMGQYHRLDKDTNALRELENQLEALNTDEYQQLVEAARVAESLLVAARSAEVKASGAVGSAQTTCSQSQRVTASARAGAEASAERAIEARSQFGYDAEYAAEQWQKFSDRDMPYQTIAEDCTRRRTSAEDESRRKANHGTQGLSTFLVKHKEYAASDTLDDWRKSRKWLSERVGVLRETGLGENQARMNDALATAKSTFRNDVAVALNEHLEWLSDTVDRMNAALRDAPTFSNGERYQFRRNVRPAYERLLQFIKDVAQFGPVDDMFGGAGELPAEFEELMREKTEAGAKAVKSPLDDYREFYDFDIEVLRVDGVTGKTRHIGWLSKRVGSGSGGEHRSPLYVIAGAAMSSAYRVERGDESGMRLLVIDEAFIKMDPRNIVATMRYFEELGLQVFMASTGDALGTLTAFLDRYYDIMRDAESNVVALEGHDILPEVREMFRADLPEFNPALIEEEILKQSPRESMAG